MLSATAGDDVASLRDHAIILLLSVYGLRSGEVRRLRLDDIDWSRDRIRIVRSKSLREEILPVEARVGNAIARYLRDGRPRSDSKALFLTLRGPHRPLSPGGLYNVVRRHLSGVSSLKRGCGPHALRHACARHLLESGRSFKEVGDHLGHRSPDATRFYAKVDLASLRLVAFDDLGGLA
jgi:integrase